MAAGKENISLKKTLVGSWVSSELPSDPGKECIDLDTPPKGTKLIHKELFSGLLAPIFCWQMEKSVPSMLNAMNKA